MDKIGKTIMVIGATGQQGGAVTKHLLKNGWTVKTISRDEQKPASLELKKQGVEVVKGSMDNTEFLEKALEGVYGVFSIQNFWEHGYEGELRHGKNVIDAAQKGGVKHFVQSSVGSSEVATQLPHFEVKLQIENYLKQTSLPYTIIKPVFFMDNFNGLSKPAEKDGKITLVTAMHNDTKLQMIAADDIGAFTAIVLENPDEYIGKTYDIAGDSLTMPEAAKIFSEKLGKEVEFVEIPVETLIAGNKEVGEMFKWFIDEGYKADIEWLRKKYPALKTFKEWVNTSYAGL